VTIDAPFSPPPYPYSRLAELADLASRHDGGIVDLSVGTPCDPTPTFVVDALGGSGSERGYPSSVGGDRLRSAAAGYLERRFEVDVSSAALAVCVGTKELVASAAWYLRLRNPSRDVVLAPAVAYPTYAMSARLARCVLHCVPESANGGLDLSLVPEDLAERALMVWLNSPANPTGALTDLDAAAQWGRVRGVPVFSDECYAEFTWDRASPSTILRTGPDGVVAVHSLSKRSNMAGMRVGFYAGDRELVGYLSSVRQHAGMMVPGPVQAAAAAALDDDAHVEIQRARYRSRLQRLAEILGDCGLTVSLPSGGFYLWVPVPSRVSGDRPAWVLAGDLARRAGLLVSPGDLYGDASARFVRVAAVQPDDRIELLAQRLEASPLAGQR
jgi:succinyldiaminopimelate transaminase